MVGNRIEQAREQAGLTRAQLAQRLGVAHSTVWRWERDIVLPVRRLGAIATALGTTVSHLIGDDA